MATVKLRLNGKIRLPYVIRKALGWKKGDILIVEQPREDSDYIIIHKTIQQDGAKDV